MYKASDLEKLTVTQHTVQGVPAGLALLVGDPKAGKSWLALDFAVREAWDSNVLYLALEDNEERMQSRLKIIGEGFPPNLTLSHTAGTQQELEEYIRTHRPTLIIIDTLEQYAPGQTSSYQQAVSSLNVLHRITQQHPTLLLLVLHHTNKQGRGWQRITGNSGIAASVDTLMMLTPTNQEKTQASFNITGRDIESRELQVELEQGQWVSPEETQHFPQKQQDTVIAEIRVPWIIPIMALLFVAFMTWGACTATSQNTGLNYQPTAIPTYTQTQEATP